VKLERRRVDRPATEADLASMKEGTIEMTEMHEEPIVAKRARVVEEIVIGEETTEQTTKVRDKLRKTSVEIQRGDPGHAVGATLGTSDVDESDFRAYLDATHPDHGDDQSYLYAYRFDDVVRASGRLCDIRPGAMPAITRNIGLWT
jgi:hypothetical protein